jgi:DNA adenine methylase
LTTTLLKKTENKYFNPTFVKWAGGKTQLLDQFKKHYPKDFNNYFEPFIGSGSVFFYIKQKFDPKSSMISDNNLDLINLYSMVRDNVDDLIEKLNEYKIDHYENPKQYFYKQRDLFNKTNDVFEKSALLIYLNKTCFNGLYRVNSKGEFNVPFGKYKHPSIIQEEKLLKASELLQDITIKHMDFEKIIHFAEKGDFVYFDPPYYPLNQTSSFTSYHKKDFLKPEQERLAKVFERLDDRGCYVLESNSDTPLIHRLYEKYDRNDMIHTVMAKRMINSKASGRGEISELLIKNYW